MTTTSSTASLALTSQQQLPVQPHRPSLHNNNFWRRLIGPHFTTTTSVAASLALTSQQQLPAPPLWLLLHNNNFWHRPTSPHITTTTSGTASSALTSQQQLPVPPHQPSLYNNNFRRGLISPHSTTTTSASQHPNNIHKHCRRAISLPLSDTHTKQTESIAWLKHNNGRSCEGTNMDFFSV